MSSATTALVCTGAPLAGFILALIVLPRQRLLASAAVVVGGLLSLVGAASLLAAGPQPLPLVKRWLGSGGAQLAFGFLLDAPNLLMGTVVAGIALCITVYSHDYMRGDKGWSRYFAFLGLFTWSMLSFVYAANLLQMFIFWELVGLASFLLIGFWYEKPAAAAAARKAFVMTRIGDVGLFVGIVLLFQATGTLDVQALNDRATLAAVPPDRLATIAVLFFCGVVGKSAQFPLHTWLPDAMEGPTPVSALLHSATMVAAGVFLFARFHGLFMAEPIVAHLVLSIALVTALLSATMAMVQTDIKRVLAYSSISQLGFMLLGLAAGSRYAGLFHLTTHACFKALLFLCAGSYIHQQGTNDMVAIGRAGGRSQRWTTAGLIVGGAALAGVPAFAGFFSKEAILAAMGESAGPVALGGAYLASLLTAYYTARMVLLIVRPNPQSSARSDPEPEGAHAHHAHGGDGAMTMSIVLLTLATLGVGFLGSAIGRLLQQPAPHPSHLGMGSAVAVAAFGIVLAWWDFGRKGAEQLGFLRFVPAARQLFERKWYIDEIYDVIAGGVMRGVSRLCAGIDARGLDAAADRVAAGALASGKTASDVQAGRLQFYIATAVVFVVIVAYVLTL